MARTPIHPGEILGDELEEIGLSAKKLADVIDVPPNRLYQLLAGKRSITADTALRLSQYFGMSADFWMNLQSAYELDLVRKQLGKTIQRIPQRNDTPGPRGQRLNTGDSSEILATPGDCLPRNK
jgi:addiction module HigA family antidote